MSTPILSGSLVLLQSAWPILRSNGQAINLLLATATDLGEAGTDSTYGGGLVNLTKAFQPVGNLTIKTANKKTVNVNDLSGTVIANGALGKLSRIKNKLANYTAFDGFERNFSINLSNLIRTPTATAALNPLPSTRRTNATSMKLSNDTIMTTWTEVSFFDADKTAELNNPSTQHSNHQPLYLALDYKDGTHFSVGNGYSTQYAYAKALYGDEALATLAAHLSNNTFSQLADGGKMLNYGFNLNNANRIAFAWHTNNQDFLNSNLNNPFIDQLIQSNLFKIGFTNDEQNNFRSGITLSYLKEENGLIGSQIPKNSALGFNQNNKSVGVDFSFGIHLNENNSLLIEKGFAITKSANGHGLVAETSAIYAQSFGGTFLSKHIWQKDDALSVSIKQPLRVTNGKAAIIAADVDEMGYAQYNNTWVGLAPSGRQTDYLISYEKNLGIQQSLALHAFFNDEIGNVNHQKNAGFNITFKLNH